jgi:hypothetical protein
MRQHLEYRYQRNNCNGGGTLTDLVKPGVAELSIELHNFISSLVFSNNSQLDSDQPFETIGNAFRFAFALGFQSDSRVSLSSKRKDIGVRGFRPEEFRILIEDIAFSEGLSLGAVISEYAESGAIQMKKYFDNEKSILQLLDETP